MVRTQQKQIMQFWQPRKSSKVVENLRKKGEKREKPKGEEEDNRGDEEEDAVALFSLWWDYSRFQSNLPRLTRCVVGKVHHELQARGQPVDTDKNRAVMRALNFITDKKVVVARNYILETYLKQAFAAGSGTMEPFMRKYKPGKILIEIITQV